MKLKHHSIIAAVSLIVILAGLNGCGEGAEQPVAQETPAESAGEAPAVAAEVNPFFETWETPFGIPPFDRIRDEHYKPAFERGIEELRAEIAAIRDNPEPPTFENTVEALQVAGRSLTRVADTFGNVNNTDTNDFLQELDVEMTPRLTRERDSIYMDEKIFARVDALFQQRETLGLDDQAMRLLELTHLDFVRRGAALDESSRARMKEINARLSELTTVFGQNLLKETNSFELVITDVAVLVGLSDNMIGSAKAKSEEKGDQESTHQTERNSSCNP